MSMSRQDYEMVAAMLLDLRQTGECDNNTLEEVARYFSRKAQGQNSRFDHPRFMRACGIEVG